MAPDRALVLLTVVTLLCECESCWTNNSLPATSFICYQPLRVSNATSKERDVLNTLCHHKITNISDVTVGVVGVLGAVIAPVALGLTFVNAKRVDIGDGMMFQWIMNVSMWLVGMVINFAITEQPTLYYYSTTGGVLLSLGLVAAMVAIKLVGMAVMMVVAGGITLISGWITNEFILCKSNHNSRENIAAIVCVTLSTLLVILVKSTGNRKQQDNTDKNKKEERMTSGNKSDDDRTTLVTSRHPNYNSVYTPDARSHRNHIKSDDDSAHSDDDVKTHSINRVPRMDGYFDGVGGTQYAKANRQKNAKFDQKVLAFISGRKKFLLGYGISLVVGILFGFQFLPLEFLKSCHKFPCYSVEYVFGHLSGSLLTSSLVLIVYCAVKRCQVTVSGTLVGHALCAGLMWGLGLVALLSTNDIFGVGIGLPVTLAGSCIISSPVGVIFFKEIRGWYIVFYLSLFTLRVAGMVLYAVSYN